MRIILLFLLMILVLASPLVAGDEADSEGTSAHTTANDPETDKIDKDKEIIAELELLELLELLENMNALASLEDTE